MEPASAILGLAIPVFRCAKALADRIELVCYSRPLHSFRALIFCWCLQVASEEAEVSAALSEYEKDIYLLESLYNDNKALLDQHNLDIDLRELARYGWWCSYLSYMSDDAQNHTRPRRMA